MAGTFFKQGRLVSSTATTATAAGTTVLTASSEMNQQFTGTTTQQVNLPDASTLQVGAGFTIMNRSTGVVTVKYNDGTTTAATLEPNTQRIFVVIVASSGNGTWDVSTGGGDSTSESTSFGINYMSDNPDAETDTTGYATYADAAAASPVDGTGGSPNVTWTRSTSSPLRGTASFLFTKDAANRQGEGVGYAFTIDAADQGRLLTGTADMAYVSGTYVSGDLAFFIVDVTNSRVITPFGTRIDNPGTANAKLMFQFATFSDSSSYRLCIHVASVSALAYVMKFDNFSLGPSVVALGAAMTDWTPYAATITGAGTETNKVVNYRRIGDSIEVLGYFKCGTVTATPFSISLPTGLTLSTVLGEADKSFIVGNWARSTASGTPATLVSDGSFNPLIVSRGTSTSVVYVAQRTVSSLLEIRNASDTMSNNDGLSFRFVVPISGWSSNVNLSGSTRTAPTIQPFTSGSGTYTTPAGVKYLRIRMVGGGGGGSGSSTDAANDGGNGGTGGNTTFGTSLLTANGGTGATHGNTASQAGGTATINSPAAGTALQGGSTNGSIQTSANAGTGGLLPGAAGAASPFGGAGGSSMNGQNVAIANTGSGGGGGSANANSGGSKNTGNGGAAGGYIDAFISNPLPTYSYAVGAAGTAGTAGTGGNAGGAGGSGYILVEEYYANEGSIGTELKTLGAVVTEWQAFTPTGTWTTNTTYTGKWRRVGDSMEIEARVNTSGAPDTANFTLNLPTGYVIDTNKVTDASTGGSTFGIAVGDDSGNEHIGAVKYGTTTAVRVYGDDGTAQWTQAVPFTFGASDNVYLNFSVPIVGWTSNVNMSSSTRTTPTVQKITASGSGTYTTPAGVKFIRVRMAGAGGGGGGSGTTAGTNGTSGGSSTFGTSLLTAPGGSFGNQGAGGVGGTTPTINGPAVELVKLSGGNGGGSGTNNTVNATALPGAMGGGNHFGGAGSGGNNSTAGVAAKANTGGGGGGAGCGVQAATFTGAGGGAGSYIDAIIPSPVSTYSYTVGAKGTGSLAGGSGFAGGDGADGVIIVEEYYANEGSIGDDSSSSSGSFGINHLDGNPDGELDASGWATYADAAGTSPVDGTGGSPTVTFTQSASSPLRGDGSFLFTKDAANRQGEGASYDFSIDTADKGRMQTGECELTLVSGTFVTGDLTFYIVDVTNGIVIQPSGYQVVSVVAGYNLKAVFQFQAASNSTSYRLCLHVATTSASAYVLKFDSFRLGPTEFTFGVPVTDWVSFTPTSAWVSNATHTGRWRRVGDTLHCQVSIDLTGAPTSATLTVNLPAGMVIDTAKLPGSAPGTSLPSFGTVITTDGDDGNGTVLGFVSYTTTTSVLALYTNDGAAGVVAGVITQAAPFTYDSSDWVELEFSVPIVGWAANAQMSDSAETRVVSARAVLTTTQTGVTDKVIPFNSVTKDTHSAFNSSTGVFTAPVPGTYAVAAGVVLSSSGTPNDDSISIRKNTSETTNAYGSNLTSGNGTSIFVYDLVEMNAGDTIDIFVNGDASFNIDSNGSRTWVAIHKLSGPSQIAASEKIYLQYIDNGGQALTANTTNITFSTKVVDSHGAWSGTVFTAPRAGFYTIMGSWRSTSGDGAGTILYKNGSVLTELWAAMATTSRHPFYGSLYLMAGETISIRSDSSVTLLSTTNHTISISSQG